MQLVEDAVWIRPLGAHYALGLDGIGATLVLLAGLGNVLALLALLLTPLVAGAAPRQAGSTSIPIWRIIGESSLRPTIAIGSACTEALSPATAASDASSSTG